MLVNRVNHGRAARHLKSRPQLAIFAFDHIGLRINLFGRYEADILELVGDFLRDEVKVDRSATALDIGANIGNHSVFLSEIFARVLAFEPNPRTFKLLDFNSNGRAIEPFNFGASDADGRAGLAVDEDNVGGAHVTREGEAANVVIELRRLDDVAAVREARVGFIKIDVEGHELAALRGAEQVIDTQRPIVMFEQDESEIAGGTSPVIDFLRAKGYCFMTVEDVVPGVPRAIRRGFNAAWQGLFGFRKALVPAEMFEKRFHYAILAIPDER